MNKALTAAVFLALAVVAAAPVRAQILQRLFGARLQVEVVDHRGRPAANVPVGMQEKDSRFPFMAFPYRTGTDGRATIPVPRRLVGSEMPMLVRVGIPLVNPVEREVDLRSQEGPVRLQLPPTGQLRVIVYDQQERPRKGLRSVGLRTVERPARRGPPQMYQQPVMEDDNAVFPYVDLGMRFEVTVQIEGLAGAMRVTGEGPTRADEMVVLPVRATTGPPVASLRVLDQQGQPVADEVLATIQDNGRFYSGRQTKTDTDGRLRMVLNTSLMRGGPVMLTVWRRGEGELTEYRGAARIKLGELRPGENDQGDLQLGEEPIVASGRVVDADGEPLPGVTVSCALTFESMQGGSAGGFGFFGHAVRTDDAGVFVIRELGVEPAELRLNFRKEGYQYELQGVPSGAVDRRFVLDRAAGLDVTFADFPANPNLAGSPELYLLRADGGEIGSGMPHLRGVAAGGGAFRFRDVAPGQYDLEVRLDEDAEPVYRVPALQLEADRVLTDPRLQEIDWRTFARLLTLTVVGPDGQPASGAMVWTHHPNGQGGWSGEGAETDADGVARLFVPLRDARISIDASAHRRLRLSGVVTDQKVTLQALPIVEVHLQGALPEHDDVAMWPGLERNARAPNEESWGMSLSRADGRFDERGVARISVPGEGAYTLSLRIRLERPNGASITGALRRTIEVDGGEDVQVVTLEIDDRARAEIRETIERIRRRS